MSEAQVQTGRWGGAAFLLLVIAALGYGGWQLSLWLEDEQQAPVQLIEVSGDRTYIEEAEVASLVRRNHPGSFFELDVNRVHRDIEALPWVYRASVRKRWPNSLNIFVVEQVAAARWNSDLLLNQYGESFDARLQEAPLPDLFGPGGSEKTALEGYRAMQSLLQQAGLSIKELTLSERFAWYVRLDNGVRLNLGRSEFVDRLQRFIDLYPLLLKQDKALDYVDLRYDTGLAVGWQTQQES